MKHLNRQKNKGVYTVEFTLVSALFLLTIFMVMEAIRYMYLMNAASEITRRGARLAVVCDVGAGGIVSEMAARFPNLTAQNVNINYLPPGCGQGNCQTVTVGLTGLSTTIVGVTVNIPNFTTTLPRESLNSTLNPTCA
jgi:Flp pilus assembly protein TadG